MPDNNQGGNTLSSIQQLLDKVDNSNKDAQGKGDQPMAGQEQNKITRGVPLTAQQEQTAQTIQQQIEDFEGKLEQKSNTELKNIATKLETAEREMLLEKIDQELQTMKETIVNPGDAAASAAAAGAATVVLNETSS